MWSFFLLFILFIWNKGSGQYTFTVDIIDALCQVIVPIRLSSSAYFVSGSNYPNQTAPVPYRSAADGSTEERSNNATICLDDLIMEDFWTTPSLILSVDLFGRSYQDHQAPTVLVGSFRCSNRVEIRVQGLEKLDITSKIQRLTKRSVIPCDCLQSSLALVYFVYTCLTWKKPLFNFKTYCKPLSCLMSWDVRCVYVKFNNKDWRHSVYC